jgi:hypothetical protein
MAGVTPNIRLNLPTYDQPGWDTLMAANLQVLDSLVSRGLTLVGAYVGVYTPGSSYILNQVVTDPADSSLWQAGSGFSTLSTNTFAQERAANPTHWTNVTTSTTSAATNATLAAGSATASAASATAASTSQTAAAASATAAAASALAAVSGAALNNVGRNVVHNGLFRVWQRGTGPFTGNGTYSADRWMNTLVTSTMSTNQYGILDADRTTIGDENAVYALQCAFVGTAGAGDYAVLEHRIESLARLAGKTVTFSFWAKATSSTPKIGVCFGQVFGTGGSPSASTNGTGAAATAALTTTFQLFSFTFTVPSIIGKVVGNNVNTDYSRLQLWLSSGATNNAIAGGIGVQSGTVQIWGAQLEVGSGATVLEKPDIAIDIVNCQRFYQLGYSESLGYGVAGSPIGGEYLFPVRLRSSPTMTILGTSTNTNVSTPTLNGINPATYQAYCTATITGQVNWATSWSASADL